jgi:hypothetical protein
VNPRIRQWLVPIVLATLVVVVVIGSLASR